MKLETSNLIEHACSNNTHEFFFYVHPLYEVSVTLYAALLQPFDDLSKVSVR